MTATITYCLLTLIAGLIITIAVAEAYTALRPRFVDWLHRCQARWINRKFHRQWKKQRGTND